jgi:Zn-dependent peptidase ImmA (M78 family)
LLGERVPYKFDTPAINTWKKKPEKLAPFVREAMGLQRDEPIRDICGLLEDNGVKVLQIAVASHEFFGLSVGQDDGGPAVIVNTWDRIPVERWIFSAAHELGHLLMHLSAYDASADTANEQEEKEADLFAAQFLMPNDVFDSEWNDTSGLAFVDRVLKVKRIFHVSWKTVVYRLVQSKRMTDHAWAQFQSQYKAKYERSVSRTEEPEGASANYFSSQMASIRSGNEPDQLSKSEFQEDRLRRLVRKGLDEQAISLSRAAEILDCSIQDMRALTKLWV